MDAAICISFPSLAIGACRFCVSYQTLIALGSPMIKRETETGRVSAIPQALGGCIFILPAVGSRFLVNDFSFGLRIGHFGIGEVISMNVMWAYVAVQRPVHTKLAGKNFGIDITAQEEEDGNIQKSRQSFDTREDETYRGLRRKRNGSVLACEGRAVAG